MVENLFVYDPLTGIVTWKTDRSHGVKAGDEAGWIHKRWGYRTLQWPDNGHTTKKYTHRVAWYLFYGEWPPAGMQIDHINGIRTDNRIVNLRLVTPQQNRMNEGARSSLPKGVSLFVQGNYKRWRARIKIDRKQKHLGYFDTTEQASAAYNAAALELFGSYARLT